MSAKLDDSAAQAARQYAGVIRRGAAGSSWAGGEMQPREYQGWAERKDYGGQYGPKARRFDCVIKDDPLVERRERMRMSDRWARRSPSSHR
jgi:hypothetical protein